VHHFAERKYEPDRDSEAAEPSLLELTSTRLFDYIQKQTREREMAGIVAISPEVVIMDLENDASLKAATPSERLAIKQSLLHKLGVDREHPLDREEFPEPYEAIGKLTISSGAARFGVVRNQTMDSLVSCTIFSTSVPGLFLVSEDINRSSFRTPDTGSQVRIHRETFSLLLKLSDRGNPGLISASRKAV